ncbi:TetR family transcriptional regulator [Brenneria corticis]|uniref:TetR family transcriptional regulator n=2 Tax=Brenneria corticis TaxID=2173106 RepID=A0A2U1TN10_9GAMM|nr:TetR/AcrR family transcriptional regulator [Brenneria sp. CFCC 11842]PWC10803.1 TetR family transcriptional regulator [Brenneria sp. CFCC 11842]
MTTSEHIVTSALKLFYRHGFHAAGVDLLAEEAGMTKKTLYRHYPSKDALIDAALALRHQQFMKKLRSFVESAAVELRPLAYIDFIAGWTREDDFHGCAFINATAEYGQHNAAPHRQAAAHKQEIRRYLIDLCAAGGAQQPESIAEPLYLLGEGLIVASQVLGHNDSLVEAARSVAGTLWSASSRH